MEELKHSFLYSTLELEQSKMVFGQELRMKDDHLAQLEDCLAKAIREKDDARLEFKRLLFENLQLQRHLQQNNAPVSGTSSGEDESMKRIDSINAFSSSDCDESIVSSPAVSPHKPLPEKGKLLQAVLKSGPLLQTLLLAGPLPQWKYPPPPLEFSEIPPFRISASSHPQGSHSTDSIRGYDMYS